jgi:hypothetical protein
VLYKTPSESTFKYIDVGIKLSFNCSGVIVSASALPTNCSVGYTDILYTPELSLLTYEASQYYKAGLFNSNSVLVIILPVKSNGNLYL